MLLVLFDAASWLRAVAESTWLGYHAEGDEDYQARVASALAGLTEAQRKRWNLISAFGLGEDVQEDVFWFG